MDFKYVAESGGFGLLGLFFGLLSRSVGVLPCVLGCGIKAREKAFCVFAYFPKVTVQASIVRDSFVDGPFLRLHHIGYRGSCNRHNRSHRRIAHRYHRQEMAQQDIIRYRNRQSNQ